MKPIETFRLYQSNPNDNQTGAQAKDPFKSVLNYLARKARGIKKR